MSLLILSASDVDQITSTLSPESLQLSMARVFVRLYSYTMGSRSNTQDSGISMPPRIVFPTTNHTALFMPARIGRANPSSNLSDTGSHSHLGSTAIKVVSVPNSKEDTRGLPGTTLVLDEETGAVKAVVNARKLTALRNAAGSLLSTSLVGPLNPRSIVAFGAGQQIESHLELHIRHFSSSISKCTIINRTKNERSVSLQRRLSLKFPDVVISLLSSSEDIESKAGASLELERVVKEADIVICATSSTSPLFPSTWVKSGAHVILIGSYKPTMREVDRVLILRSVMKTFSAEASAPQGSVSPSPILLVDSCEACMEEAGEIIDAKIKAEEMTEIGKLIPDNLASFHQLISNSHRLSTRFSDDSKADYSGPITLFKSVGIALQDVAIAAEVVDKALETNIGMIVPNYDA